MKLFLQKNRVVYIALNELIRNSMQHAKDEWQPKTPPWVFTSTASFYFRREFLTSAASFSFMPWTFLFCRELFFFAVSFSFLPWAFRFCRELFFIAVALVGHTAGGWLVTQTGGGGGGGWKQLFKISKKGGEDPLCPSPSAGPVFFLKHILFVYRILFNNLYWNWCDLMSLVTIKGSWYTAFHSILIFEYDALKRFCAVDMLSIFEISSRCIFFCFNFDMGFDIFLIQIYNSLLLLEGLSFLLNSLPSFLRHCIGRASM